jgi:hypothetical protein
MLEEDLVVGVAAMLRETKEMLPFNVLALLLEILYS